MATEPRTGLLIHELFHGRRTIDVVIREDQQDETSEVLGVATVTYNPKNFTPPVERSFLDLGRNKGAGAATTSQELILAVVTEWDVLNIYPVLDAADDPVLDEDGKPTTEVRVVGINREELDRVPAAILGPIMMAIVQDLNPKLNGRNGSGPPAKTLARSRSTSVSTKD